jgi:hypothetical protein
MRNLCGKRLTVTRGILATDQHLVFQLGGDTRIIPALRDAR